MAQKIWIFIFWIGLCWHWLLQLPAFDLWLLMAHPPCCPKFDLSSASSPQALEMWLLMKLSQVQVQGVEVARQEQPDVISKVKIWKWLLTKWHSIHAFANSSLQQSVHAHGRRVWCQHTPLVNCRFNCDPSTQIGMHEHSWHDRACQQHSDDSNNCIDCILTDRHVTVCMKQQQNWAWTLVLWRAIKISKCLHDGNWSHLQHKGVILQHGNDLPH